MKIFFYQLVYFLAITQSVLAQANASKLTDGQREEMMAMIQTINHKTLPYQATVRQQMLAEANYFASQLHLPMSYLMRIADIRYSIVFDPWYGTIKETNAPYFPATFFGRDICNTNIPREQRLCALKIGVSGTLETTNFFFSFGEGKLLMVERLSEHAVEYYAHDLNKLVGQPSLIDTNGAYQLATQWLAAVDVDMTALNKLKWTVNQLHYKAHGTTNYVTLPLYYVDFGSKHHAALGNLKAYDEPLVSVEVLAPPRNCKKS